MIDFHCHLLPEIDDGADDLAESMAMASMLAGSGFTDICCTPHLIKGNYDADSATVRAKVEELQSRLDEKGVGIRLHPGREYYADEFFPSVFADPLTLCGSAGVLFEVAAQAGPEIIKDAVYGVVRQQCIPLLAHPERYPVLHVSRGKWFSRGTGDNDLARNLRDMGCHFQGNIGSFAGSYGKDAMRTAITYLEKGYYSCLGTDGHSSGHLDWVLRKGLAKVEGLIGREELENMFRTNWSQSGQPVRHGITSAKRPLHET